MNKPIMADKENLRDRNAATRTALGEASQKLLGAFSKREGFSASDKSARLVAKKDAVRITPTAASNPLTTTTNIQNYTRKILQNMGRTEEQQKETSQPMKKTIVSTVGKSSLLNTYLSRDKDLRYGSKPKAKRDDDSDKRKPSDVLQHSKSILQMHGISQIVGTVHNPIKKSVRRAKESHDVSSLSNLSEVSDVSRNARQPDDRVAVAHNYRSTDKNPSFNFNKEKNFFGKKTDSRLDTKPKLLARKNPGSSINNKSRIGGSESSVELTPDKVYKASDKPKPVFSGLLGVGLTGGNYVAMAMKSKETQLQKDVNTLNANALATKISRIKKEKLICMESLIVKNETISIGRSDGLSTAQMHPDGGFLTKTLTRKRELTVEEEIANFVQENKDEVYTTETLGHMVQSEAEYMPDPYYLDKNQNELKWKMRAVLLDWLVEVSSDFTLKISTFHYAVNYIDRFLSAVPNVQKSNFQLVGLTALCLASKLEEVYVPHLSDFAVSASNLFSVETIKKMELFMLKTLKWRLNPPTLHMWANWYTCQWDYFLDNSPECKVHPLVLHNPEQKVAFRHVKKDSYYRYREIMQLLDCALLDVQTLQYKLRPLVAAFMYIILGKDYSQFALDVIIEKFPTSSLYLLDKNFAFNDLFGRFLDKNFGFQLEDLLPCIQYASTFFSLSISQDPPSIVKMNPQGVIEGHFEEFLAYEIHNGQSLTFVTMSRKRNIM